LRQQKKFRVLALDMLHICAEYELVTWIDSSDVIRVLKFVMQPISADYALQTWLASSNDNHVFVL
jgi:hypothetical protein